MADNQIFPDITPASQMVSGQPETPASQMRFPTMEPQGIQSLPSPQQSFAEKATDFSSGKTNWYQPQPGDSGLRQLVGLGQNLVGGLVQSLTKTPVTIAQQVANVTGPGQTFQQTQLDANQSMKMLNIVDQQVADKIYGLKMAESQGDPTAAAKITRLQNFIATRNQTVIPEVMMPAGLDKTPKEMAWDAAEFGASTLLMGTKGIFEVPYFQMSKEALLGKAIFPLAAGEAAARSLAGQRAVVAGGLAVENALFAAIYAASAQSKEKNFDWKSFWLNTALGTAAGTALTYGASIGLAKLFKKTPTGQVAEFAKDIVEGSSVRAARGLDDVKGFDIQVHYNPEGKPIKEPVNLAPADILGEVKTKAGTEPKILPPDFTTPQIGDYVRTAEGLRGVIGSVTYTADVGTQEGVLKSLLQERSTLTTEYQGIAQSSAGGPIASLQRDRLENLAKQLSSIDGHIQSLLNEGATAMGEQSGPRTVELKVQDSSGQIVSVYLPETSLTKGGTVLERQRLVPTDLTGLYKQAPGVAKDLAQTASEITNAQLSRDRVTVEAPGGGRVPVPTTGTDLTDAEMLARGNTGIRPDFRPTTATTLNQFFKETQTLESTGVSAKPLTEAERMLDRERATTYGIIRELTKPVLAEAGLPENLNSFRGLGKLAFNKENLAKLQALSERLFNAANGDIPLTDLTASQQALVQQWQKMSANLLDRVNAVLVAKGKEPIIGRQNYITHILTAQAQAALDGSGAIPSKFIGDVLGAQAKALFRRGLPKDVVNNLLKQRTGGFPIERDFFRATSAAIDTHLKFIHFEPAVAEVEQVMNRIDELAAKEPGRRGIPQTNRAIIQKMLLKVTGRAPDVNFLRAFDSNILEILTADKWFTRNFAGSGITNPFRNFFGEMLKTEHGDFFVPKKKVLEILDKYSPSQLPRNLKRMFYTVQMAFNVPFGVLNLTQFWGLGVPRLRGSASAIYTDAIKGFVTAVRDVWSPAKWEFFTDRNVLTDIKNYEMLELGAKPGQALGLGGRPAGVMLDKALSVVTDGTEFINRVASYHAAYENMTRGVEFKGGLSVTKYYDELNNLSNGEFYKKAEDLAQKLAESANFKYGITHRAPIQDNPFLSLWDQFNSYFRNWVTSHQEMWRNFKDDKQVSAAIKDLFNGKGFGSMAKVLQEPETWKGKRGELVRFYMNATAMLTMGSVLGGSFAKGAIDMYLGGGPRFVDGFGKLMTGIVDGDQNKVKDALSSILVPPSVPPVFDAASGMYQYATGKEKFTVKGLITANYSPFKKIANSFEIAKAAITGQPVPIHDPKTGKVTSIVEPNAAVGELLFGYRSYSTTQHFAEMDQISHLNAVASQKQREQSKEANAILDELMSVPAGAERTKKWNLMTAEGRITPDMATEIIKQNRETKLLMSDTVIRQLKALPSEYRIQFMESAMRGMAADEQKAYALHLSLSGAVTPTDAGVALRQMKDKQPSKIPSILYVLGAAAIGLGAIALTRGKGTKAVEEAGQKFLKFGAKQAGQTSEHGLFQINGEIASTVEKGLAGYVKQGVLSEEEATVTKRLLTGLDESFKKAGVQNQYGEMTSQAFGGETITRPGNKLNQIFLAKDLPAGSFNGPLTLMHELGHASYNTLLSKDEQDIIGIAFRSKTKEQWAQHFADMVGGVINDPAEIAKIGAYGAQDQHEFFAEAFKYYTLTREAPSAEVQTIFDRIIAYFKNVWSKLKANAKTGSAEDIMASYVYPMIEDIYNGNTIGILDQRPGGGPGIAEGMAKGLTKDINKLVDQARFTPGWRVEHGGSHWKIYPADKTKPMVVAPVSPSDMRSLQNMKSQLRRAGLEIPH